MPMFVFYLPRHLLPTPAPINGQQQLELVLFIIWAAWRHLPHSVTHLEPVLCWTLDWTPTLPRQ